MKAVAILKIYSMFADTPTSSMVGHISSSFVIVIKIVIAIKVVIPALVR
jgi:hypothetical protein